MSGTGWLFLIVGGLAAYIAIQLLNPPPPAGALSNVMKQGGY